MVDLIAFFLGLLSMMSFLCIILMRGSGWQSLLCWRQLSCQCGPWLVMCWVRLTRVSTLKQIC